MQTSGTPFFIFTAHGRLIAIESTSQAHARRILIKSTQRRQDIPSTPQRSAALSHADTQYATALY